MSGENTMKNGRKSVNVPNKDFDFEKYIVDPNTGNLVSEDVPEWTKGLNYKNCHKEVLKKDLFIPTPALLVPYIKSVIDANKGKIKIYDAAGNQIKGKRLSDLWMRLTISPYGIITWLNAKFVKGSGFRGKDIETVIGLDNNGNLLTKKEPLESCLMESDYVMLDLSKFNSQGLPKKEAKSDKPIPYNQAGEILFSYFPPESGSVAKFDSLTTSVSGDLTCWGELQNSDYGTIVCAKSANLGNHI